MLNQNSHLINAREAIDTVLKTAKQYLNAFPFIIISLVFPFISFGKPIWNNLNEQNPIVILLFFGLLIFLMSQLIYKFIAGRKLVKVIKNRGNSNRQELEKTLENLTVLPDKLYLSVKSGLAIGYILIILVFWSDFAEVLAALKIGQNPFHGSLWLGPSLLFIFPLLFLTVGIWQRNNRLEQNYLQPISQLADAVQKL
jgi:hypothetical protein